MNLRIEILSVSQTNWEHLIQVCEGFIGVNPTRVLDSKKISVKDSKAYPIALGSLASLYSKTTPIYKMLEIMKHVHFSLIIECDSRVILESLRYNNCIEMLETKKEDVWLCSGTLKDWIDFTVYFSQEEYNLKLRTLANFLALFFDKLKMRIFWDKYQRVALNDKSFILREKV